MLISCFTIDTLQLCRNMVKFNSKPLYAISSTITKFLRPRIHVQKESCMITHQSRNASNLHTAVLREIPSFGRLHPVGIHRRERFAIEPPRDFGAVVETVELRCHNFLLTKVVPFPISNTCTLAKNFDLYSQKG